LVVVLVDGEDGEEEDVLVVSVVRAIRCFIPLGEKDMQGIKREDRMVDFNIVIRKMLL